MEHARIHKPAPTQPPPHLLDYEATVAQFSWVQAAALLDGLPGGAGLNMAYEAVDRHVKHGRGHRTAIRWLGKNGERQSLSYTELARASNQFANALEGLGVLPGERVFVLMGRLPELYVAVLGALKARCVVSPLFSAFGPEPIVTRAEMGDARVLVTTPELYQRKVRDLRERLPGLKHVIVVGAVPADEPGVHPWGALVSAASTRYTMAPTDPESTALLHFTSGTTGRPKGVEHAHAAVLAHAVTGRYALDLHDGDVFWCTADPGWVTGTSYGILAPLVCGVTNVVVEAEFDAQTWYGVLQSERVTVWYTAPTAIRMMMKLGADALKGVDLSALRFMASVGEPLNPEAVVWGLEAFGLPFHDNWWQTETGGIMVSNYAAMDIKPGSMGKPLPGITAAVVRRLADGCLELIDAPDVDGELALKTPWPSMMRAYLHEDERYRKCFVDGWYLTGDLAHRDADGYYWFVGRADDVIKSSGHLIGPFEVESALMEHPAVAEAGVIGLPDPMAGEVVKAFVALKPGYEAGEPLRRELLGHARKRLGAAVAPKQIDFRDNLPKTRSGKIMRRLLKARELGLPEGDLSTLESDEKKGGST
ncbi:MAG: acetate--CoA ligase [Hydrogenophaga sp.]|uniref:acetate--CoA ligase n=1 Tax=Hydrogenophaga sp. TaxID=1904254 RepID=UPI001BB90518|nr:acetate--CoA ligase [Hydrogenophaga sp.]MBS3910394.1 acetate--CoA ligase [Hydrogenophaga sp.]MDO9146907.1 acetate--CoA ligase [Hydrogenophaga sp.]MDO9605019.1 acetate--CoA ligase [Hydrogenophaga sp.]MDP2164216.1 acetate--CoA ligase [Hydrogenophaga sp.]MDP3476902.1 acetate--CoA ligase [Hydrogenophaga sp.]